MDRFLVHKTWVYNIFYDIENIQGYCTPYIHQEKHNFQLEHYGSISLIAGVHFHCTIDGTLYTGVDTVFSTSLSILQAILKQF